MMYLDDPIEEEKQLLDPQLLDDEQIARLEDERIERLEEIDPSTDDGRWGGDYCVHGVYVGTPGGADYLCGLCEDGLTFFVKRPLYQLGCNLPTGQWYSVGDSFDDPSAVPLRTFARMRRAMKSLSPIIDSWQVKIVSEGYWDDPFVEIVPLNVSLRHRAVIGTGDVHDIEAAVARLVGVPSENVFVSSFDEEVRGLHSWIYANVQASIDRRELDDEQLGAVAAYKREEEA